MRMNLRMTLEQQLTICKHWTSPGSMPPPSPCAPRRRIASCSLDRPTRCGLSYDHQWNLDWWNISPFPFWHQPKHQKRVSPPSKFLRWTIRPAAREATVGGKRSWALVLSSGVLKIFSFVCGYILLTFKKLDRRPMTIRKYSCEFKMTSGGGQGHRYLREYVIKIADIYISISMGKRIQANQCGHTSKI